MQSCNYTEQLLDRDNPENNHIIDNNKIKVSNEKTAQEIILNVEQDKVTW